MIHLPTAIHTTTATPATNHAPPPRPTDVTPASTYASTALQPAQHYSPWSALQGVVSDCLFGFSASCLQRKLLVFVNRLSRLERVK